MARWTYQTQRSTPTCSKGGKEAEELFQLGLSYEHGIRGMPFDTKRAMKFYEESLELGNPKAALNGGMLFLTGFATLEDKPTEKKRFAAMHALFEYAIKLGCPDGYYLLAGSYYNGWGVPRDVKKGDAYMRKGVEAGSIHCMFGLGMALDEDGKREEAKPWLHRALAGGLGFAGYRLSIIYRSEKNAQKMIECLRAGATLGDTSCLFRLWYIYLHGECGQIKDEEYAQSFKKIHDSINEDEPPPMIDLDKLCPQRPVLPFKE